jgi:hypothetical protein
MDVADGNDALRGLNVAGEGGCLTALLRGWLRRRRCECQQTSDRNASGQARGTARGEKDHDNDDIVYGPVIQVNRLMPDALAAVLRRAPLTPEKVAFSWRTAVGPAVDKVTVVELRADVLYVRAKDAAWQCEIERSAALIRSRLDGLLGDRVVRRIVVVPI